MPPAPPAAAATPDPDAPAAAATDTTQETARRSSRSPTWSSLADRVKAKVLIGPADPAKARPPPRQAKPPGSGLAAGPGDPDSTYEVREVRLFGGVSFHQDPAPGKTKGQDATGEALILLNEGPGQAIFNLYHRDSTGSPGTADPRAARGPAPRSPPKTWTSKARRIGLNQKTDQAWAYGPGKLVQLTDRGLLTDKAEDAEPEAREPERNGKRTRS